MKISNYIKTLGLTLAIAAPMYKAPLYAQLSEKDRFEKVVPPPEGSSDSAVLNAAPNPEISIHGKVQKAVIVVDLSKNVLFKYDSLGVAEKAYLIASGKPNTPTDKGVRIVTHIEKYPYRTAPKSTKRRKNPGAYGPNIICLNKINPDNGEQSRTGEFIHGNSNKSSLGKYASLGCIRMDNEVIKQLSKEVKRGDIIIIK